MQTYNTQQAKIPSIAECYKMMKDMLPNIREHSEQVMKVASSITENLKSHVIIDKDLVIAASLLHDITKTQSLVTKERHDKTGGLYLRELGFEKVAEIVEEHVELNEYSISEELKEKEIVFYADKRVMHNIIVSIDERIADLIVRYGKTDKIKQIILKNKESILDIGNKINNNMTKDIDYVLNNIK